MNAQELLDLLLLAKEDGMDLKSIEITNAYDDIVEGVIINDDKLFLEILWND